MTFEVISSFMDAYDALMACLPDGVLLFSEKNLVVAMLSPQSYKARTAAM